MVVDIVLSTFRPCIERGVLVFFSLVLFFSVFFSDLAIEHDTTELLNHLHVESIAHSYHFYVMKTIPLLSKFSQCAKTLNNPYQWTYHLELNRSVNLSKYV